MNNNFINLFLEESVESIKKLDQSQIQNLVECIDEVRLKSGRIFFLN